MNQPLLYEVPAHWLALIIFLLILVTNWLGFRFRQWRNSRSPRETIEGLGPVESSLLGLMALMLSFTFSLSYSKFEEKRKLIIEEANHIGTAILRSDLYPDSVRALFRQDFKEYVEARISYFDAGVDQGEIKVALERGNQVAHRIWTRAAQQAQDPKNLVRSAQMIPALNNMIDIVTTRDALRIAKVPPFLLAILLFLVLVSSFIVGYGEKGKAHAVLVGGFAFMSTLAIYLILELDRPKRGTLNHHKDEQRIVELRELLR